MEIINLFNTVKRVGINVVDFFICKDYKDAENFLNKHKKIVLKLYSDKIVHKTEYKAVFTNITDKNMLKNAWDKLIILKKKYGGYIMAQKHVDGIELIVALKRDEIFDYVIMVGLGGIYVEVFKDVVFLPLDANENEIMKGLQMLKSFEVIKGARGRKNNIKALIKLIKKLKQLTKYNFNVIEFNPVILNEKDCYVVDIRVE